MKHAALKQLLRVMARFSAITLGLSMVLLLGAFFLAYFFKDQILQHYRRQLEKSLNVNIAIQSSQLRGLQLQLRGVQAQTRGGAPLARIERLKVNFRPWAGLTHGAARWIDACQLEQPQIDLILDEQGRLNWDSVTLPTLPAPTSPEQTFRGEVRFEGASLSLRDQRQGGFLAQLPPLQGQVVVRPDRRWTASAQGAHLKLHGQGSPGDQQIRLQIDDLPLEDYLQHPELRGLIRAEQALARGSLEARWGPAKPPLLSGKIGLSASSLALPSSGQSLQQASAQLAWLGGSLSIEKARALWQGMPIHIEGEVKSGQHGWEDPWLDLRLRAPQIALKKLQPWLKGVPVEPSGTLALDILAEGPLSEPQVRGRLKGWKLLLGGQHLADVLSDFELDATSLHIEKLLAHTGQGEEFSASGWIFRGGDQRIFLRLQGGQADLRALHPWLGQGQDLEVTALGSLLDPILTGHGQLAALPHNPLGLTGADGNFWIDSGSALVWNSALQGSGGEIQVPWAVLDLTRGQLAGAVTTERFNLATPQALLELRGGGQGVIDLKNQNYSGTAWLEDSRIQAGGLPSLNGVRGYLAFEPGAMLVPQLEFQAAGDPVEVTGSWNSGQGNLWLRSPGINLAHWLNLPGAQGTQQLMASARVQAGQIDAFRLSTRGTLGDAWAVGRWLPGQGPELYTQFANLSPGNAPPLVGELATRWNQGRMQYLYRLAPEQGADQTWAFGQGWLQGNQLHLAENFLHQPSLEPVVQEHKEGRAYSYFGPLEGPPLITVHDGAVPRSQGTLSWKGRLDLQRKRLQVDVQGRQLRAHQLAAWFGPLAQPAPEWWVEQGVRLEEAVVDVDARGDGPLNGLQWSASLRSPWTRLSRNLGDELRSTAFSWRTEAELRSGRLRLTNLLSPRPQDWSLMSWRGPRRGGTPEADWLRSRLELDSKLQLAGWVRAEAFPMSTAGWFTPGWVSGQLPSGKLSTGTGQGLRISGSLSRPLLDGRVDLVDGRFWTGFRYLPIDQAYADLKGHQGRISLSRFLMSSNGLTVQGRGHRSADGSLVGQLWADDLSLETLRDFGWNTQGWQGKLDLALRFRDAQGVSPEAWLALESGGLAPPDSSQAAIRHLVLGEIEQDSEGLPTTGPGRGVHLSLQAGQVVVQLPPSGIALEWDNAEASELKAQGQISWRSAPRSGQSLLTWMLSKDGPRFGNGKQPAEFSLTRLSWTLLRQLAGLPDDPRQGLLSGQLWLLGQYFEQHRTRNPVLSGQPLVEAQISQLQLEGSDAQQRWSGMQLAQPIQLAYQVFPGKAGMPANGRLSLSPTWIEFFHRAAAESQKILGGKLAMEGEVLLTEGPGAKKLAPSWKQYLRVGLEKLPLQNLGFLTSRKLDGMLEKLELSLEGSLNQSQGWLTLLGRDLQFESLRVSSAQGRVELRGDEPGKLKLTMGQGDEEFRWLLGAPNDLTQSLRIQGQAELDFDRLLVVNSPTLVPSWKGWSLSGRSQFDLSAQLQDPQMRLLSALAPEGSLLTGNLKAGLQLRGTAEQPELSGNLDLERGGLAHPQLRSPLTDFNLQARFERLEGALGRYTLQRLDGLLGGQPFRGSGQAELLGLDPQSLEIRFDGDELPIQWDGLMDGRANVHLLLSGAQPALTGTIEVPEADFWLPSKDTLARLGSLSQGSGRTPLGYNIAVQLGEDCWGHYLNSAVRGSGELQLVPSSSSGKPVPNGRLFLSRGVIRIPLYEVNFRVRQGYAYFEDNWLPRLDNLEADSTLGEYQITARIDGQYPKVSLELFSNPPLAESELRRVVAGGLPSINAPSNPSLLGNALGNSNNFLVNQGMTFLSNLVTGQITQGLGRLLSFSELSFDVLPTSEYALRLAKALDDKEKFLITFAQVIGTTRFNQSLNQYGIEYRFQPNLMTRFTMDNYGQARLWFQGVLRF